MHVGATSLAVQLESYVDARELARLMGVSPTTIKRMVAAGATLECPFDSRDDVQERDYPGNLEDPFDDRRSPQHDIELAIEFNGVFHRLQEYTDDRGVDELGGGEVDDQVVADGQRLVESLLNLVCRVEVVFPGEYGERGMRLRRANLDSRLMERGSPTI